MDVPKSLRVWFVVHFVVDILFAIPLLFFPIGFLGLFGLTVTEPLLARLIGAALLGIGGNSMLMHKKGVESFMAMLELKVVWSISAIVVIAYELLQGLNYFLVATLAVFAMFSMVWIYYTAKLRQ